MILSHIPKRIAAVTAAPLDVDSIFNVSPSFSNALIVRTTAWLVCVANFLEFLPLPVDLSAPGELRHGKCGLRLFFVAEVLKYTSHQVLLVSPSCGSAALISALTAALRTVVHQLILPHEVDTAGALPAVGIGSTCCPRFTWHSKLGLDPDTGSGDSNKAGCEF